MTLLLKRVYEAPSADDGFRILVDRLWPRGITKAAAAADLWLKEVTPSPDLRKSFHSGALKWEEFRAHYLAELEMNDAAGTILEHLEHGNVTLVYAAKDEIHNHALVLREYLERLGAKV